MRFVTSEERFGKKIGFGVALLVFCSLLYFVLHKFGVEVFIGYMYFIACVAAAYIAYLLVNELVKKWKK